MPAWLAVVQKILIAVLSAVAARNSQLVPLNDLFVMGPAGGAAAVFGLGPLWKWANGLIRSDNGLNLVARLIPYREKMMPQEVRDAVLNALRWRFAKSPDGVKAVDTLILLDMQLDAGDPPPP